MKTAIYGAGGIGGYFGGRLADGGVDVHLIARGAHLEALRRSGLCVRSERGDLALHVPATDRPEEVGPCDHVVIAVKSYDTEEVAAVLGPLLGPDTTVLTLQNGVDNASKIRRVLGEDRVLAGAAVILATIAEPGVIQHVGQPAAITFGELDGRITPRAEKLLELFRQGGVDVELSDDIQRVLWRKFCLICAIGGLTAASRLPIPEILETPSSRELFAALVSEVVAVAAAEGVSLPADTPEELVAMARGLPAGFRSSLHHDLTHGHRMELEALHGTVVRRARRHGIPVPATAAVHAILEPHARSREPHLPECA